MAINDTMIYNFNILKERIIDTLNLTNLNKHLKKIKGNTICIGSGGSKVVASYASIILNKLNNCCTKILEPRDALHENLKPYKNLFICSYSGSNHGVNSLSQAKTKKYLLTYNEIKKEGYQTLKCNSTLPKEMSFISLAATLMPMSILLSYSLKKDIKELLNDMLKKVANTKYDILNSNLPFEVMSGNDTITPQIFLESTFIESGISNITIHSKYDFCHGRSTLSHTQKSNLIYLISNKNELDETLLSNLQTKYNQIIILESNYNNPIIDNYYLTLQAMYLTKTIAENKNIDLSIVNYDKDLCKKLYKYEGNM